MKSFFRFAPLGLLAVLCLLSAGSQAQVNFTSSNLPIIVINTDGAEIVDEPKINVFMGVINNPAGQRNNLTDPFTDYEGTIGIEIRGATSQNFPKKQYSVELRDPDGKDTAVALLGMPKEADWVLNAPYADKSLMRNILAYQLGRDLGHYAPRTRLCEVVLNGDYQGVYVLIEKIKRDKNRVDIAKLNEDEISGDDLTGGYIIKIDRDTEGNEDGWPSAYAPRYREEENQRIYFRYEYPDTDDIAPEQKTYIQNYVKAFEDALASDDFADPQKGYAPYIDVNSFIDYFIANEVSKNIDAYRLSTYLHKQKDSDGGELVMGPIWDYNFSFGNVRFCGIEGDPASFAMNFNQRCPGDFWLVPFWWERLMEDPIYSDSLAVRWTELRTNQLSTARLVARVDSVATLVDEAQARNFARWPILGEYIWPNAFVGETYQEELDYLKDWTTQRLTWLDENLPEPPPPVVVPDPVPPTVPSDTVTTDPPPADSVVTSIDREELSNETPVVYPNPFGHALTIRFTTQRAGTTAVLVHDLLGRTVLRSTTYYPTADEQQFPLDTSSLPPGIYVLELQVGNQALVTRKISKR